MGQWSQLFQLCESLTRPALCPGREIFMEMLKGEEREAEYQVSPRSLSEVLTLGQARAGEGMPG